MGSDAGWLQKAMDAAAQFVEAGKALQGKQEDEQKDREKLLLQFDRPRIPTDEFTLDLLRSLSWNRFEELCSAYFAAHGFRTDKKSHGADGGIDIRLYFRDMPEPVKLIQCKGWRRKRVDVDQIRALMGVMARENVKEGVFVTMSTFTRPAQVEAAAGKVLLLDGETLVERLSMLDAERKAPLLRKATEGEFWRPICARCGVAMNPVKNAERPFWGCANFARKKCRSTIALSSGQG